MPYSIHTTTAEDTSLRTDWRQNYEKWNWNPNLVWQIKLLQGTVPLAYFITAKLSVMEYLCLWMVHVRERSLTIGGGGGRRYYFKSEGPKILAPLTLTAQNSCPPSKNV